MVVTPVGVKTPDVVVTPPDVVDTPPVGVVTPDVVKTTSGVFAPYRRRKTKELVVILLPRESFFLRRGLSSSALDSSSVSLPTSLTFTFRCLPSFTLPSCLSSSF